MSDFCTKAPFVIWATSFVLAGVGVVAEGDGDDGRARRLHPRQHAVLVPPSHSGQSDMTTISFPRPVFRSLDPGWRARPRQAMFMPPPASCSVISPSPSRSHRHGTVTVQVGRRCGRCWKTATEVTSSAAVWSRLRWPRSGPRRACEACFTRPAHRFRSSSRSRRGSRRSGRHGGTAVVVSARPPSPAPPGR